MICLAHRAIYDQQPVISPCDPSAIGATSAGGPQYATHELGGVTSCNKYKWDSNSNPMATNLPASFQ